MTAMCRAPNCSRPAARAGEYCLLHECYMPGCHAARGGEDQVYCHAHEAAHYGKTGRYAFRCRVEGCPFPREPSEDYCRDHLADDGELPPEESSEPFPVATKVLQGLALAVVLVIGTWAMFSWLGAPDRPAAPREAGIPHEGPSGMRLPSEMDENARKLDEALRERGYR